MVHAEIFQAGIDHPLDVHLSGHARFDLLRRARQKFGGHHNAVPFREIFKRPAKILFAGAALVADGRIEKVHAKLQPPPDNLPGILLVDGPAVLSVPRVAESHTSHTDAGHLQFGISKSGILHFCSSCSVFLTPVRRKPRRSPFHHGFSLHFPPFSSPV